MRSWLIILFTITGQLYTTAQKALPTTNTKESATQQPPTQPEKNPYGALKMFSGNPGKATMYSLIFPGAGQYYNSRSEQWAITGKKRRLWKVPLVWAIEGTAIGILVYNQRTYKNWKEGHFQLATGEISNYQGITNPATTLAQRNQWEQNRDFAIIGLIAVHIIQSTEAFISRHLIEFDVSDDLSFSPISPYLGINLAINF